jgi:hypothetical protein
MDLGTALQFEMNRFVGGRSFIWATTARQLSCQLNQLVPNVQRTSNEHLLFHSIGVNGNNGCAGKLLGKSAFGMAGQTDFHSAMSSDWAEGAHSF